MPSPQPSDETTSHSTKPSQNDGKVAGYPASGESAPWEAKPGEREVGQAGNSRSGYSQRQLSAPESLREFHVSASIHGEPMLQMPLDLYIPPDALELVLETFQGPLDLLLYLIRKHNLDVLDIPMAELTRQYLSYIELLQQHRLEMAAEYLLMAAVLIEIKSRLLLPKSPKVSDDDEEDPRIELMRRLKEYEQMKLAAQQLNELPQAGRDFEIVQVLIEQTFEARQPQISVDDLKQAWMGPVSYTHLTLPTNREV